MSTNIFLDFFSKNIAICCVLIVLIISLSVFAAIKLRKYIKKKKNEILINEANEVEVCVLRKKLEEQMSYTDSIKERLNNFIKESKRREEEFLTKEREFINRDKVYEERITKLELEQARIITEFTQKLDLKNKKKIKNKTDGT